MNNPEYTLTKDITSYTYPSHMKRPEGFFGSNFFEKWIKDWQTQLGHIAGKDNIVGIEIGTLNGDCTIFCADQIANGKNSVHYTIDINETEYLTNNIAPYNNVKFLKGYSYEVLRHLTHNGQPKEFADYIYIDGSHLAINVMQDAVLAWYLLKDDGILIFDDYFWGKHLDGNPDKDIFTPKLAIDKFLESHKNNYVILQMGWQVFVKKIKYKYPDEELKANFQ